MFVQLLHGFHLYLQGCRQRTWAVPAEPWDEAANACTTIEEKLIMIGAYQTLISW